MLVSALFSRIPGYSTSNSVESENVVLITDRSIYIVGENIQFFAYLYHDNNVIVPTLSTILYSELITPLGNKISGNKFLINGSSISGCLPIPKDLLTGTYYIRAYTRMMRNYGPESYGYKMIRIINPVNKDLLLITNSNQKTDGLTSSLLSNQVTPFVTISSSKSSYNSNDSIIFSIKTSEILDTSISQICISVIPEIANNSTSGLKEEKVAVKGEFEYYSETQGLSLNGKLTDAVSSLPIEGKRVNLSIIGDGRDFMSAETNKYGQFYFALPDYVGSRDLFLCAERIPSTSVKIWIDNDFCTVPVHLPSPSFILSDSEKEMVFNMALNKQINTYFSEEKLIENQISRKENAAFYGTPATVLYLDQYVQLPTLEECFNELPSSIKVRKHAGNKYFKVIGTRDLSFYDPLVLVDWVAVDEPDKILAISPQNISRIEIVNETYIKGGQTYGGIISILSKKGDFAGIDLPSAGIFINYRFLSDNICQESETISRSSFPDCKNTLFWKSGIVPQMNNHTEYVINAPDTPGEYCIRVDGVTKRGEVYSATQSIKIVE